MGYFIQAVSSSSLMRKLRRESARILDLYVLLSCLSAPSDRCGECQGTPCRPRVYPSNDSEIQARTETWLHQRYIVMFY